MGKIETYVHKAYGDTAPRKCLGKLPSLTYWNGIDTQGCTIQHDAAEGASLYPVYSMVKRQFCQPLGWNAQDVYFADSTEVSATIVVDNPLRLCIYTCQSAHLY